MLILICPNRPMDAYSVRPEGETIVNEDLKNAKNPVRSTVADLRAVPLRRLAADRAARLGPAIRPAGLEPAAAGPGLPSFNSSI